MRPETASARPEGTALVPACLRRAAAAWMIAAAGMQTVACLPRAAAADGKPADAAESIADRDQIRREMQRRAEAAHIRLIDRSGDAIAELRDEPVLHYSDQPRRIIDATLWVWMLEGRPAALCKIEHYGYPEPERKWLYCLTSLSTERIEFESPAGRRWQAKEPGLVLRGFGDGPAITLGKPGRLRHMKELSRRFAATMIDKAAESRQEMRLLPQPLVRYGDEKTDLIDGALFGLTSNGTNPDALFVVELHRSAKGPSTWRFGVTAMTDAGLSVRLDEKEVFTKPQQTNITDHDTWTYFWESAEPREMQSRVGRVGPASRKP